MSRLKLCKKIFVMIPLILCILGVFALMGNAAGVEAEGAGTGSEASSEETAEEPVETPTEMPDTPSEESSEATMTDKFVQALKDKYGAQYKEYYDAIIEEWGSIENYLLSLAENGTIPDAAKDGWTAFVGWLGQYSPIWGGALAILFVLLFIVFGKKAIKKIGEYYGKAKSMTQSAFSAFNKLYNASIAQNEALQVILGENPKYDGLRNALNETTEAMKEDESEGGDNG